MTDPEFTKQSSVQGKRSLTKDEFAHVRPLIGTSFVRWSIIEGTLDRIIPENELPKHILSDISALQLKLAWMSIQVYVDIYRSYREHLLISGEKADPNDKGDSELLLYLLGLKTLYRGAEPVLATFGKKWKRFAAHAGWGDRVWTPNP